ncbi:unnamed protein product [Amaranthus hypochondriacus]
MASSRLTVSMLSWMRSRSSCLKLNLRSSFLRLGQSLDVMIHLNSTSILSRNLGITLFTRMIMFLISQFLRCCLNGLFVYGSQEILLPQRKVIPFGVQGT